MMQLLTRNRTAFLCNFMSYTVMAKRKGPPGICRKVSEVSWYAVCEEPVYERTKKVLKMVIEIFMHNLKNAQIFPFGLLPIVTMLSVRIS